jgi:DNA-binding HxlR family transcriptional regulator
MKAASSRPIMRLLDLLGRRWTLRIVWELRNGALTSRSLREACGDVSPTVLQTRLDELRANGLVEHEKAQGYRLTPLGQELGVQVLPLYVFAERWAKENPPAAKD